MRVRNVVTGGVSPSCHRRCEPPALEPPDEAGAVEEELPALAAASATVIFAPAGATSHHFAPKLSLPWPLVWPGPESPAK